MSDFEPLTEEQVLAAWNRAFPDDKTPSFSLATRYANELVRELVGQQEPELQVGDVVTLNLSGLEFCMKNARQFNGVRDAIIKLVGVSTAVLDKPFCYGQPNMEWNKDYLRLISRPKKLTVADLPEGFGTSLGFNTVRNDCHLELHCPKFIGRDEHEAVTAALEFCQKIADGMKGKSE